MSVCSNSRDYIASSRVNIAIIRLCDSFCLFVRMIKPKWLKLKPPNLAQGQSITIPRPSVNIRSKVKVMVRVRVRRLSGQRELYNTIQYNTMRDL